ncbi:hypothetical protein CYLTODRAFT_456531 [Cylindrobasidium torrendii FP15055 ss-10]|uniref:Uncharacterized protein n=1 Tax=Cylindrobasidium torrendii FP15055 ss-10 TaxID=1314674 RepID=A0A0D7B6R5_9AGAR|nr:hypothetical protein CYLTODRAFT_456531 [Cylindrobasidium torrendii FP15055 ss-10]
MHFNIFLTLVASVFTLAEASVLVAERADCSVYGDYPEYTGPCELTNCGAKGTNCDATGWSGCVVYPSFDCPAQGCTCTDY